MRIAVIGGGLLGCATTLNLALVQEHDQRKLTTTSASPPSDFHVTLFERTASLGAHSLSSILVQPNLHVHVGSSRTLPLPSKSTYLSDLIAAANDHLATFPLFSRRVPLPAPTHARRGAHDAAPIAHPWRFASHSRVVPSFAACQWPRFEYHVIHKGFYVLDLVYRFLRNPSWRVAAFAAFVHAALQLRTATGFVSRAVTLVQMVTMLFLTLLSPRHAVAIWQRQYSFWFTTISLLFKHGITPAISRGSSIAFIDLLVDINAKNRATCSISLDSLLVRTGLLPYVQTSAADYATSFKFDPAFVRRYLEPPIASANAGLSMRNISSLAAHFAMLDADFANSDVDVRLSTVLPNNAAMCPAFIDAARATMQVDVKLQCPVVDVSYDRELGEYVITCENGDRHCFDGIALCASPKVGEMTISTPVGDDLAELLGYHPHVAGKTDAPEEGQEEGQEVSAVRKEACSHIAVVVGHVNASYFRFSSQMNVPDLVQMSDAPSWSRFERIREEGEEAGVYRVICGADFLSSGLFAEMFQGGAEVRYYQPLSQNVYSPRVIPQNAAMDNTVPRLVLGDRFIYAAATRRLAKHPEMDALSAVNTASLFSRAVHWASNEEEEEEEEEGEGNDDNGEKRREKVGQDEDGNRDDG